MAGSSEKLNAEGSATAVLIATDSGIVVVDPAQGTMVRGGLPHRPTCVVAERGGGPAWCGTARAGVFRSDDGGATWARAGMADRHVTALTTSPSEPGIVWAGTEPSGVWRFDGEWRELQGLDDLPSSAEWAFPPRPDTHHVRWIACHPSQPRRLWVAVEAGALITTADGGRTWRDRVPGGPYDTHELAVHPAAPETLRSAAGDGYYESHDGGATWTSPEDGLNVTYLRSIAIDPADSGTVVVSAASHPHKAYVAGRSDGRLYRRVGDRKWQRITSGWPGTPNTIAPLLTPGGRAGELWAADERGLHRSGDAGETWRQAAAFEATPNHLRGLTVL